MGKKVAAQIERQINARGCARTEVQKTKRFTAYARQLLFVSTFSAMSGCGTYVPDYQEFWATSGDAQDKVQMVMSQTKCELIRAIRYIIRSDIDLANEGLNGGQRRLKWLEKWGADLTFVFTIEEKSTLTPNLALNKLLPNVVTTFPGAGTTTTPQTYSTTIGALVSSDGFRQQKFHAFYKFSELIGPDRDLPTKKVISSSPCLTKNTNGSLFLESDLKILDWLVTLEKLQLNENADFSLPNSFAKAGALSDEVKFEIVSSGNVTPMWKLALVSANTATTFYTGSRDRTQDLIITIGGPGGSGGLNQAGQTSALTSELGATLRSSGHTSGF
jgi:hypothetical protein